MSSSSSSSSPAFVYATEEEIASMNEEEIYLYKCRLANHEAKSAERVLFELRARCYLALTSSEEACPEMDALFKCVVDPMCKQDASACEVVGRCKDAKCLERALAQLDVIRELRAGGGSGGGGK